LVALGVTAGEFGVTIVGRRGLAAGEPDPVFGRPTIRWLAEGLFARGALAWACRARWLSMRAASRARCAALSEPDRAV
jgi:hypothetical protein